MSWSDNLQASNRESPLSFIIPQNKMSQLSLVHGPKEPALWLDRTLCTVIDEQESSFPDRTALIVPWQSTRLTYRQLADRSRVVAKALLGAGLRHGDCIGIMDGNSYEYIEIFLGAARIGCPVVVLNNTYAPDELRNAVYRSCMSLCRRFRARRN